MIINDDDYTIEIPNSRVLYCFTPSIFKITSKVRDYTSAEIRVFNEDFIYADERALFGGSASFEISAILQLLFSAKDIEQYIDYDPAAQGITESKLVKSCAVFFRLKAVDGTVISTQNIAIDAIFGSMTALGSSLSPRTVRWFEHFPQTIDLPLQDGSQIVWGHSAITPYGSSKETGGSTYYPALVKLPIVDEEAPSRSPFIMKVTDTEIISGDRQLSGQEVDMRIIPDFRRCGTYLRWVDQHGRRQYYLFAETARKTEVAQEEEWNSGEMISPLSYVGGFNMPTRERQALSSSDTITLTAQFVGPEEAELLKSLASSSFVDMYDGYDTSRGGYMWHRVMVVAGATSKEYERLNSFSVTIKEAAVISPHL